MNVGKRPEAIDEIVSQSFNDWDAEVRNVAVEFSGYLLMADVLAQPEVYFKGHEEWEVADGIFYQKQTMPAEAQIAMAYCLARVISQKPTLHEKWGIHWPGAVSLAGQHYSADLLTDDSPVRLKQPNPLRHPSLVATIERASSTRAKFMLRCISLDSLLDGVEINPIFATANGVERN